MKNADVKEELFKVVDRVEELKNIPTKLTDKEELELRNLEVKMMSLYSEWKD